MAGQDAEYSQLLEKATFIDDIETFLGTRTPEVAIQQINDNYEHLKLYENKLLQRRIVLQQKLPDLQKALNIVQHMLDQTASDQQMVVDYALADHVFSQARIKDTKTVNLWLGANVMLEYSLEEAKQVLETNSQNCRTSLEVNRKELDRVKDGLTTSEVNIARIHNYGVEKKKKGGN
eukprot:TRINITY_DN8072_c0_g1_i3.p1 TRINITY_DN8072_c0_g1~~TRINITY_DN8072_c0_g1_i3.p1  ORF type:complete len:190 (-),score=25.43 TRINITY_DN8072_c0_g1_i3:261-791(-)